jgi:hypothetical protein
LYAYSAAPGASVFGFCLVRTIKDFDSLYFIFMVVFGASLILDLIWTRRAVRYLAVSEAAKKNATQFLWSCVFFSMLSLGFGIGIAWVVWYSADFIRTFGAVWFGALTCVGIYPCTRAIMAFARALTRRTLSLRRTVDCPGRNAKRAKPHQLRPLF